MTSSPRVTGSPRDARATPADAHHVGARGTPAAGPVSCADEPLFAVLCPDGLYLRTTPLSDLARPLPAHVGKLWRGGRNAAEVAAMVWGGVVVSC